MKILKQYEQTALCSAAKSIQVQKDLMERNRAGYEAYISAQKLAEAQSKMMQEAYLPEDMSFESVVITKEVVVVNKTTGKESKMRKYVMNPLGFNEDGKFDLDLLKEKLAKPAEPAQATEENVTTEVEVKAEEIAEEII